MSESVVANLVSLIKPANLCACISACATPRAMQTKQTLKKLNVITLSLSLQSFSVSFPIGAAKIVIFP